MKVEPKTTATRRGRYFCRSFEGGFRVGGVGLGGYVWGGGEGEILGLDIRRRRLGGKVSYGQSGSDGS